MLTIKKSVQSEQISVKTINAYISHRFKSNLNAIENEEKSDYSHCADVACGGDDDWLRQQHEDAGHVRQH